MNLFSKSTKTSISKTGMCVLIWALVIPYSVSAHADVNRYCQQLLGMQSKGVPVPREAIAGHELYRGRMSPLLYVYHYLGGGARGDVYRVIPLAESKDVRVRAGRLELHAPPEQPIVLKIFRDGSHKSGAEYRDKNARLLSALKDFEYPGAKVRVVKVLGKSGRSGLVLQNIVGVPLDKLVRLSLVDQGTQDRLLGEWNDYLVKTAMDLRSLNSERQIKLRIEDAVLLSPSGAVMSRLGELRMEFEDNSVKLASGGAQNEIEFLLRPSGVIYDVNTRGLVLVDPE